MGVVDYGNLDVYLSNYPSGKFTIISVRLTKSPKPKPKITKLKNNTPLFYFMIKYCNKSKHNVT